MLTSQRKHTHYLANQRLAWRYACRSYARTAGWPDRSGYGKWWKRRLHKARRRYAKAQLAGRRGKEPVGLESEVNWRGL